MNERADPTVLTYEQHVGVASTRADHRVLRQRCTLDDWREFPWKVATRMGHTDALSIHKIAAEIGGAQRDCVACPGALSPAVVRVLPPQGERCRKQSRSGDIQQTVNQSIATALTVRFAPMDQPGHCGARRASESNTHREGNGPPQAWVVACRRIQRYRRRPGTEGQISEDRVEG